MYEIKNFLTSNERCFYEILKGLMDEFDLVIHPQINLATIINKKSYHMYANELFRNIDFAIFDKEDENYVITTVKTALINSLLKNK